MIEEIRITSLGVIDSTTLELGPGFTAITGETGAGKTMVVTALGLLLGARADAGVVRTGSKQARVEGVIDAQQMPELRTAVEELGGETDDSVVLARNVSAEGRSRAYAGGATVPIGALSQLTEPLVAVHGQSDQHRLLATKAQRDALDRFGGPPLATVLVSYRGVYDELQQVRAELAEVTATARDRAREADLLRFGVGEIEAVGPQPGEDVDLAAEEQRLGHADSLRLAAERAREALSNDQGGPDAVATIASALASLDSVSEHDSRAAELAGRVRELSALTTDLATDVSSYATGLETDPQRLATVSERRAALTGLTRKYGATVDEVLTWCDEASAKLLDLDGTDDRIVALESEQQRLVDELARVGAELSDVRTRAADELSALVTGELTQLAMKDARLEVEVTPAEPASHGADDIRFLLAANAGAAPRPLNKGASGGELSRVMLALEVALAATSPVPTFVFDEVDAGVGGAAAVELGRRLAQLARTAQVLVVTHLPQVAAYADQHVLVEKADDGTITTTGLTTLDSAGRERELSRMLAGLAESDTALAHARELLEVAAEARAG